MVDEDKPEIEDVNEVKEDENVDQLILIHKKDGGAEGKEEEDGEDSNSQAH